MNQIVQQNFARGPWLGGSKASFSWTNQTMRISEEDRRDVRKILLNLPSFIKRNIDKKTARNFPNFFEEIYSSDVLVSHFWMLV